MVIDVGARDTETLRLALVLVDTVLVPAQPRELDVWEFASSNGRGRLNRVASTPSTSPETGLELRARPRGDARRSSASRYRLRRFGHSCGSQQGDLS